MDDSRLAASKSGTGPVAGEGVTTSYDGFGRLVSSSINMGGTTRSLGYLYDPDDNRTRITHPDGGYIIYDYDGLDRMAIATGNSGTELARFAYDRAGRRSALTSGGTATAYTYDGLSRPSSTTSPAPPRT